MCRTQGLKTIVCSKCRKEKKLSEFYKRKGCKDGYDPTCRECKREWQRQYQQKHKKERGEYNKRYYLDHLEEFKEYNRRYSEEHRDRFEKALESANRKYGRALKRLAE